MITPGIRLAIGHDIKAQLAFRPFHPTVRFPCWNPDGVLGSSSLDLAFRHSLVGLLDNADALPDLLQANHQPVIDITVLAYRYVKFEPIINTIRVSPANIVWNARSTQERTRSGIADGIFCGQDTLANSTRPNDLVFCQEAFQFIDFPR